LESWQKTQSFNRDSTIEHRTIKQRLLPGGKGLEWLTIQGDRPINLWHDKEEALKETYGDPSRDPHLSQPIRKRYFIRLICILLDDRPLRPDLQTMLRQVHQQFHHI
jgi:hypothetical protein